jgi:K+ transporter
VPEEQRLEIRELGKGFYTIRLHYGFMDQPNVVRALVQCRIGGLRFNLFFTRRPLIRHRILISFAITLGLYRWTAAVNALLRPRVSLSSR